MNLEVPNILLYSIVGATFLIYLPFTVVGYARAKVGFDVSAPRAAFDKLPPYGQRATWAHQNSFETFMVYAAAAIVAYVTGVESNTAAWAAITFLVARLLFSVFYIINFPLGRSLMFGIGSLCSFYLFVLSIQKVS